MLPDAAVGATLLTMIMTGCVIITTPPVNLLTAMEMVFVTISVPTTAEEVRETDPEMVPAISGGTVADMADAAGKQQHCYLHVTLRVTMPAIR